MKGFVSGLVFLWGSLMSAQSEIRFSRVEACSDIDSLCRWYVEHSWAGCNDSLSDVFRSYCASTKESITDSISVHDLAFTLARLISRCNDAHFALDWVYMNREFPRSRERFPFRIEVAKDSTSLRLLVIDDQKFSQYDGAEWIDFNGEKVNELLSWTGSFVSVEDGAEGVRDFLAACWLPLILPQSNLFANENVWGFRKIVGNDTLCSFKQENFLEMKSVRRDDVKYHFYPDAKAVLTISSFSPRHMNASLREVNRFFRAVRRKGTSSVMIDLRSNGGGNSAWVEYLYSFLDTAGVIAPFAIIQRNGVLARRRLQPWMDKKGNVFRKRMSRDEDARISLRLLNLPDGQCDTVYLKDKIVQEKKYVYGGKCVVAVNGQTASAAAHFATIIQRNGRGIVIGQPCNANVSGSGGNAMPVYLPKSRIRVLIPLIRYINFHVNKEVGKPLIPDLELWPAMHDISDRKDVVLNHFLLYE
jgi:hypothetical protein